MTQSLSDHTQILIDDFGIDEALIQTALEARRQRGGALDTALQECGLREDTVLAWMSRVLELTAESYQGIRTIPQELSKQFPRHVAETFRVFPTQLETEKAVLICYQPLVERLKTQLQHRLERELEFKVTTETNFHAGLEHLYGKPPRPRWAAIIEKLEAEVQRAIEAEAELEELGLQDLETPKDEENSVITHHHTVAFWAVGEKRGDEFVISSLSTEEVNAPCIVPLLSLPWLPADDAPVTVNADTLNNGPLGETFRFRAGDWITYQSTSAELPVYVLTIDGGLPEVEKLALDVALGRYKKPDAPQKETEDLEVEDIPSPRVGEPVISQLVVPQGFVTDKPAPPVDLGKALGLLSSNNPDLWSEALELLDQASDSAFKDFVREHFPGQLQVDPLDESTASKPLDSYSGLTHLAFHRPQRAAPSLVAFLESNAINARYLATRIFAQRGSGIDFDLKLVARRLFDRERKIRRAAIECIERCRDKTDYGEIVGVFEERLKLPVPATQVATIHILGQLRELRGVTHIVNLCASEEVIVAKAAQSFMALITGHHFGADIEAWKAWWVNHGHLPRSVWLVRALRSRDARLRQVAIDELRRLHDGQDFGFEPGARSPKREKAVRLWEELLEDEGLLS